MPSLLRARAYRSRQTLAFVSLAALVASGVPRPASAERQAAPEQPSYQFIEIGGDAAEATELPGAETKSAGPSIDPEGLTRVMEPNGQDYAGEVEPNGTFATATPILAPATVVRANVWPAADVDFYSFSATAGDRIYAATMTSASAANTDDSVLQLLASDGVTIIETDNDNGTFSTLSSTIAGATIPSNGTYFLRVAANSAAAFIRPYELYLRVQSGAPTAEVEPNDSAATATPLPVGGWVSGSRNPAADIDFFSFTANAGDTVFLSLDLDPERDGVAWNGLVGLAPFGDPGNQFILIADDNTAEAGNRLSEAFFMTVKTAGTYTAVVGSQVVAAGPTQTYHLSVTVRPAADEGVNCTTYTSTDVPKTIGPTAGLVSSVITVPGNPRIADLDVSLAVTHANMGDLDIHLRSPAGNDNGLFTDLAFVAANNQSQLDMTLDDEAAFLANSTGFAVYAGMTLKPENNQAGAATASASGGYRLNWFDGENAGGTWTLDIRDDAAAAGGTLNAWSLRICEPPPPPACAPGSAPTTVFSTDFESGAAAFTHAGVQDEWELGLPATVATTTANPIAPFNSCNSGVNCWKTDLDNTYNNAANNDLLSPAINLSGLTAPVVVTWAQRHQIETATYDHFSVDYQQVGGATPVRLYEWLDPTPISVPGAPAVNVPGSAGWGVFSRRADSLANLNTQLRFHFDSDGSIPFAGVGIDDVSVTACRALSADLSITKTDGSLTATAGAPLTYMITASNAGPDPVANATVADTFPGGINCPFWTCTGAGGGTCTANGGGNINDVVSLPTGGSVTYTASCSVGTNTTGTIDNTATVSSGITDPTPTNNSATDSDTVVFSSDLAITKTDGVTTATPGGSVTYTITASNAGPSNAIGATVADTFPASLTCNWTCAAGFGSTCTAAGSGNINDLVDIGASGSVTYTASCSINGSATGTLSNTATVAHVTDPNTGNNSATDNDTLTPEPDVAITKTDGVTTAAAGGSLTYTITASNAGPSNATAATVDDTFPASLTCTWTCTGAGGGTCTASGSGDVNDTVNLPAGGSVTYAAPCSVSPSASGSIANTATVTATGDPNLGNNSATDTDTVTRSADIAVAKTVNNPTPPVSTNVTYTVTATNNGPADATGVVVTDVLPSGLTFVSSTPSQGSYTPATGAWTVGNLANAASATLGITATVTRPQAIVNQATRTGGNEPDPNRANNTGSVSINGPTLADVQVQETVDNTTPTNGQNVTFTVTAHNAGPGNATGVVIEDNLPAGLTFVSATPSQGIYASGTGLWTVGAINNGATATLQVVMTVTSTLPTTRVVAKTAQTEPDVEVANDSDSVTLNDLGSADLALSMVASQEPVANGTTFTYTIVVANHGPASATNVTVTDSLPAGLTFVSAQATQGSCAGTTNISCPLGTLADGASASIALVVTKTVGGPLSNSATAAATEPDPFMNNNTNGETTTPVSLIDFKVQ